MLVLTTLLALPMAPTTSPVGAKQRRRTVTRMFRNGVPITLPSGAALPSPVAAGYYPTDIAVAGPKGTIRDVNVRLNAFSHTWPDGVEPLLVRPCAQTAIAQADAGGTAKAEAVTLTMDDEAAPLPDHDALQSGAFRPTIASGAGEPLVFDGSGANGTWRLFVQDDYGPSNSGVVAGGWELEIMAKVKVRKTRQGWPYRIARQLDLYTGPPGPHTVDTHPGAVFRFRVTIQKAGRRC